MNVTPTILQQDHASLNTKHPYNECSTLHKLQNHKPYTLNPSKPELILVGLAGPESDVHLIGEFRV